MTEQAKPNYSEEDVAVILEAVPFDLAGAKELAEKLGRGANGWRSIVAKVKRLENDETVEGERPFYLPKPAYQTKQGKDVEKKSAIVAQISAVLGGVAVTSLEKAGKADLERLRAAIIALAPEVSEDAETETTGDE